MYKHSIVYTGLLLHYNTIDLLTLQVVTPQKPQTPELTLRISADDDQGHSKVSHRRIWRHDNKTFVLVQLMTKKQNKKNYRKKGYIPLIEMKNIKYYIHVEVGEHYGWIYKVKMFFLSTWYY